MMDEYITWSDELKQFGDNITLKELLKDVCETWDAYEVEEGKYFRNIGLKDINGKSIYADCSIVELTLKDNIVFADFTGVKPTVWNEIKMIGYFTFNDEDLRYEIDILDWEKDKAKSQFICLYYNFERMSNFKIIDTIQENKLGLIKEQSPKALF